MADSRRHWKFIVRDAYGYVIQNAHVNVYLPGTTTVFSGTAYDAVTAGNVVTNPFTSNAQGEVEAWFDTDQSVDIAVDDNSDTAYRAVDGAGGAFSFAPFTEKDDIYNAPADSLTDDEIAAAYAQIAHGAAQHTDITRSIWLRPEDATLGTAGTPPTKTALGAVPDQIMTLRYADAATGDAYWSFIIPSDWASGVITAQPYWSPGSTDGVAHTVRWQYGAASKAVGGDVDSAGTTTAWTGASATRTATIMVIDTATSTGVTPGAAGELFKLNVARIGADGADTYVGTVDLVGVLITYTANQ
jgi:hypothetical protein